MPSIDLSCITNHICSKTSLSIRDGELMVLAGATGAGKTTLLNVIAGLVPYTGSVSFDGVSVDDLPPAKRNVGYLFQAFALFPHLTVHENIGFGLAARGGDQKAIQERVETLLRFLGIRHLEARYPKNLSGGEKQRVALARTLAPCPKVLLLDEPFNSLDPRTAKFLRLELKSIQRKLSLTALYVTHNYKEAFEMGNRVAVVREGRIEQVGTPQEVIFSPRTPSVSRLFGAPTLFSCSRVEALDFGLGRAFCDGLSLIIPYEGKPVIKIAVMPGGVCLSETPVEDHAPNRFTGAILNIIRTSPVVHIDIRIGEAVLTSELPEYLWDGMDLKITDLVHVTIPLKWIRTLTA